EYLQDFRVPVLSESGAVHGTLQIRQVGKLPTRYSEFGLWMVLLMMGTCLSGRPEQLHHRRRGASRRRPARRLTLFESWSRRWSSGRIILLFRRALPRR